jgi:limonene 1,2-monooxygenase
MAKHILNWSLYEEQARLNGHVADRDKWRLVTLIHVAETREKARENVRFGIDAFRDYFSDVGTFPIVPPDIKDPYAFFVETGAGCIGTPDDAIAYIENLLNGAGGFGAIMELAHNWADWDATKRHYELMARFVHPHFQRSRELRRGSYAYARDHHEEFSGQSAAAVQVEIDRLAERKAAAE